MSDLVGNPEDRFSRIAAHMICGVKQKSVLCFLSIESDLNQAEEILL